MIGSTVDQKYEVIRLLGQGGMGAVFEVRHVDTNRRLALKVIHSADASKVRALVLRLQREARAAGSIDSPHIGQVIDAGTDPATETPYLVMELLDGEDLQQVLNRVGPLRPDVALRLVAQACLGLEKAHEARVVHRDVKPANLFVARQRDGSILVKVLDFGIAKLKQEDLGQMESGSLTRTGSVLGSPLYMSPEQARGAKAIDQRADLWSLGVVAYQLLTNRTPYQEIDALGELILAICSELPPCVQDFAPWVDPAVAATIHKALSLDPAERYQTAGEMFAALAAHLPRGEGGAPDLALREDMLVGADAAVRSVTAPRLVAEMGRRPAITARMTSQHVITPAPLASSASTTGSRGDRVSAAEIEAGPTLMLGVEATAISATSQPGVDGRGRTEAGLSRSSPAASPAPSRGPLFAGVAAAAIVIGVGVAFLTRGALGTPDDDVASRGERAADAPRPAEGGEAPASAAPSRPREEPNPAATPAGSASAPASASAAAPPTSAARLASSAAAPTAAPIATGPVPTGPPPAPPRPNGPSKPAAAAPPAPAAAEPGPAPAGTSGFGDRE